MGLRVAAGDANDVVCGGRLPLNSGICLQRIRKVG